MNTPAEKFYSKILQILHESTIPFMVGGTYAFSKYTGIVRPTKDFDIFTTTGHFLQILTTFRKLGLDVVINDDRWLARVQNEAAYADVIFNVAHPLLPITEAWFRNTTETKIFDQTVLLPSPTLLVLSKLFVQSRHKYDGADVAHLILTQSDKIDWRDLLSRIEPYWEVLLEQVVNFRFVYPSERDKVPDWLLNELIVRMKEQMSLPLPKDRVCRGKLVSSEDYQVDIEQFGYKDVSG